MHRLNGGQLRFMDDYIETSSIMIAMTSVHGCQHLVFAEVHRKPKVLQSFDQFKLSLRFLPDFSYVIIIGFRSNTSKQERGLGRWVFVNFILFVLSAFVCDFRLPLMTLVIAAVLSSLRYLFIFPLRELIQCQFCKNNIKIIAISEICQ